ncbi:hypothetical protein N1851_012402 [Merluccius polli]|uniref:SCAN box domain-containing protein n=1 Tax=Merluccius polli TaxID=89951 RepID=A0AA47MWJ5_MERPO|nr:hypothetical protein N1851_012402 [Merluccius polli]
MLLNNLWGGVVHQPQEGAVEGARESSASSMLDPRGPDLDARVADGARARPAATTRRPGGCNPGGSAGEGRILEKIVLEQFVEGLPAATSDWVLCHRPADLAGAITLTEDHLAVLSRGRAHEGRPASPGGPTPAPRRGPAGNCLADLLAAFIDPDIMNKDVHIKRKLKLEEGEGSGVLCDCLSEFWGEFYSKCTLGTEAKTPYLRCEYQVQEWQAIARILVMGWTTVRYFPLLLPLPFLEEAFYGTRYSSVTDSCSMSQKKRKILELALESFESVDKDDLMDVLDAHDCQARQSCHMTVLPLKTQWLD